VNEASPKDLKTF